jgi:hypothetical protein
MADLSPRAAELSVCAGTKSALSAYQLWPRQISVNGGLIVVAPLPTSQLRADDRSVIFAVVGCRVIADVSLPMCFCSGRPKDAFNTSSPTRHS